MHETIPHEHAPHDHARDDGAPQDQADHKHQHQHQHQHQHDHAQGAPHDHAHDAAESVAHTHAEDGLDTHGQGTPHAHAPEQVPENTENLILDIGADTGALIIHAAADRDQAEVEISPAGSGQQARSHNIVRRREAVSGAVYAAVFPALTAGDYTVWRDTATPAGTVAVQGGRVASFRLK